MTNQFTNGNKEMPESLYAVPDLMKYLGMSRPTIYRYIRTGQLESIKIGGSRRVTESALQRFIESHTEHGWVAS